MSDAIETHLGSGIRQELQAFGLPDVEVAILSADLQDWRFRVEAEGRTFEAGFTPREQLWCREVTVGRQAPLFSNDEPRIGTSAAARSAALRRIARALRDPASIHRDPPVI